MIVAHHHGDAEERCCREIRTSGSHTVETASETGKCSGFKQYVLVDDAAPDCMPCHHKNWTGEKEHDGESQSAGDPSIESFQMPRLFQPQRRKRIEKGGTHPCDSFGQT